MLQTLYFASSVLNDILKAIHFQNGFRQKIHRFNGFLFTSIIFPCTIFVSTAFWSVFFINREWVMGFILPQVMVLPEVCDEYVPKWLNHSIHTNVSIFLIIEVLITNQLLPSFRSALTGLTILTVIYDIVFFTTYFVYGRFVYGLFHIFNWPERILFIFLNYCGSVCVMKLGLSIEHFKRSRNAKVKLR
ncbi:hypothetical protein ABEB36_007050 [Hypothenemus hampei]